MKKPAVVVLPELTPHWHPPGCDCEPARPYIRVSKVGAREEVKSPVYQMGHIEAYARRENLRLLPPVCDIDKSGRTFRKRSVDSIISEIKAAKYKRIVLWKWSRWARNEHESTKYVHQVVQAGGRVDSATEDFDQKTAMGRFQFDLTVRMDQLQSELISESWVSAQQRRRDAGLPHGGRARFGYKYVKIERPGEEAERKYVIDDAQADFLKAAYADFNKGVSLNKIAFKFNSSGFLTTLGGPWTAQSVARMMDTGFAAGLIRERSQPTGAPANSIKSYDVWRRGAHSALIDQATWDTYKKRRYKKIEDLPPRSKKAVHGLSALLFCSECGRRLVTKYAGAGRTHQWQCPYQKAFHFGVAVTVNNRLALIAVRDWVRSIVGSDINVGELRAQAERELAQEQEVASGEQQRIIAEIQVLDDKIESLLDLAEAAKGRAKEKIDARLDEYQREIERLSAELEAIKPKLSQTFSEADQAAFCTLDEVWGSLPPDVLRDALAKLVSRIVVSPRSASSTRKSVADRVRPVGWWEAA